MTVEKIGFYEIPSNPKDRQEILDTIENCRAAQIRVKSEQTYVTDAISAIAKKYGISTTDIRRAVRDRAENSFAKTIETSEKYQDLYQSLFPNAKKD